MRVVLKEQTLFYKYLYSTNECTVVTNNNELNQNTVFGVAELIQNCEGTMSTLLVIITG